MKAHASDVQRQVIFDKIILYITNSQHIRVANHLHDRVQISEYLMTVKPVFTVSFGRSAFGQ
jgi:hypothetical protein